MKEGETVTLFYDAGRRRSARAPRRSRRHGSAPAEPPKGPRGGEADGEGCRRKETKTEQAESQSIDQDGNKTPADPIEIADCRCGQDVRYLMKGYCRCASPLPHKRGLLL